MAEGQGLLFPVRGGTTPSGKLSHHHRVYFLRSNLSFVQYFSLTDERVRRLISPDVRRCLEFVHGDFSLKPNSGISSFEVIMKEVGNACRFSS